MATTTVGVTPGSGDSVRVVTNSGVDGGAKQQIMSLGGPDGTLVPTDPDGSLDISLPFTTLLLDSFDGTLATNWSTGGTAPTSSGGQVTFATSTTASASSYMRTIGAFQIRAAAYGRTQFYVRIESAALTNATRWWGVGSNQSAPSAGAPVANGAVFMLDYTNGALQAATYNNGTRTTIATLTRPSDGAVHRYEIWYRQQVTYWLIDGLVVATAQLPSYGVFQAPYLIAGVVNFSTGPSSAPTLVISSASIADTAGNNRTVSDGVNPWLQATVKTPSTVIQTTDTPLVVGLHPSSPLPAGTNIVGAVAIGTNSKASSYTVSTTTNAAVQLKTSSGDLQTLIVFNASGSAQWIKLFNATSVTLGTTAAVIEFSVAAGGSFSLPLGPNGLRFNTGLAYAVTGAAGLTNNTAGAGSVSIATTYV